MALGFCRTSALIPSAANVARPDAPAPAYDAPTRTARLSTDQRLMRKVTRADLGLLTVKCLGNPDYMNGIWHAVDDSQDVPPQYR